MAAIYLDHSATTPLDKRALECMIPLMTEHFGNASSTTHVYGWQAAEHIEIAREKVARAIGAEPNEILFTSGATESNNLALKGIAFRLAKRRHPAACKFVSSATEHSSVIEPLAFLKGVGLNISFVDVTGSGHIDPARLAQLCADDCDLVSLMHVNNETGTIHNIEKLIGALSLERSSTPFLVHCDATQSLGKIPIDVRKMPVDLLSFSSHKIYGPKGVGALYMRTNSVRGKIDPLIEGGAQELGLRGGTLNTAAIVGFGEACKIAAEELEIHRATAERVSTLFLQLLRNAFPHLEINGDEHHHLPHIVNIFIPRLNQAALFSEVGAKLAISAGSACSSGTGKPSHVLKAMGCENQRIKSSFRVSFGRETTDHDVLSAVEILINSIQANTP